MGAQTPGATGTATGDYGDTTPLPDLPPGITAAGVLALPRLGGYLQVRDAWRNGPGLTATLNRARISADGALYVGFTYRFLVEYEASTTGATPAGVSLREAYMRWARFPWSVTLGQFKAPFSREYLLPIPVLETPDFASAVDVLSPKYDIGLMVEALPGADISVSAGVFNGEGQNAAANRDSTLLWVGRITGRPIPQVALGAAVAQSGSDSTRLGFEAGFDMRGFSVRGEYITLARNDQPEKDEGWYVLGTYRTTPWLSLVLRQEDLHRVAAPANRRFDRATTAGLIVEFPGGKLRALIDWVTRTVGDPGPRTNTGIVQMQVRF